jgi:hypothetical protein
MGKTRFILLATRPIRKSGQKPDFSSGQNSCKSMLSLKIHISSCNGAKNNFKKAFCTEMNALSIGLQQNALAVMVAEISPPEVETML